MRTGERLEPGGNYGVKQKQQQKPNGRRTVLSWEEGLANEHLGENTANTPHIHSKVVVLPEEHDLGGPVIACGNVSRVRHVRINDPSQAKVTDLQVTRFIHQNVAGLQVPVKHSG